MLSIRFASKSRTKKCNINRNFLSSSSNTQLNKNAITLKEKNQQNNNNKNWEENEYFLLLYALVLAVNSQSLHYIKDSSDSHPTIEEAGVKVRGDTTDPKLTHKYSIPCGPMLSIYTGRKLPGHHCSGIVWASWVVSNCIVCLLFCIC